MMTALTPGYYLWVLTPKEEAMKVQAKSPCSSPMYVVVEESPNYYIAKDSNGFLINLHKSDYEPVQEWLDVTGVYEGDAVAQLLQDHLYRLVRHDVVNLHKQFKAYAYLLEKVKQ